MGFGGFLKSIAAPAVGLGVGLATMNPALGLAAGGAVSSALKQGKANKLQDERLDITRRDIAERQPLRDEFTRRALAPLPTAPNLSRAFSATSSNPFSPETPFSLADLPSLAPQPAAGPRPRPRDQFPRGRLENRPFEGRL